MGNSSSSTPRKKTPSRSESEVPRFQAFTDKYETLEQVVEGLRKAGLESSNLIIGVDYTKSNETAGKNSYNGYSLHSIIPNFPNPYAQVIRILGRTLESFDDDKLIPCFIFGDRNSEDKRALPFFPDKVCHGFEEVLTRYEEITPHISLYGPTSFGPVIREAIKITKNTGQYHILLIIGDGAVTPDNPYTTPTSDTIQAIVEASNYPISIVMVGVGDGPWDIMKSFDDGLPQRRFDNFQFVDFHEVMRNSRPDCQEADFSLSALQEIPEQYQTIRKLGLLG
eukprot:TRINITY_DN3869_c0_g1_i2.p1 TRINITY_DN3869_c0_g1~~TRINITY_DN3869_c0_g1_i2.p1  ORF type:complete len:281 (+),score=51.28 TRINITY_DN3869_c0_g1_i2:1634-2476(+)